MKNPATSLHQELGGKRSMLTGNSAIAYGAALSRPKVIPAYPITPQTEIIESLSEFVAEGLLDTRLMLMESEHSVLSAAITAEQTGARTFTATSSQGLLLMHEMLYIASGTRCPIVMANVSRGLSAPITLGADENDILGQRDAGWIQLHCETCQEALDSVIMAYKISENKNVLLPSMVNIDGFILSFTREPVDVPSRRKVDDFLPEYSPETMKYDANVPISQGVATIDGISYSYFRMQHHLAATNAVRIVEKVQKEFNDAFGRNYASVEQFMMEDAEYALMTSNAITTVAKSAVRRARARGEKVGLLRIRLFRPFPTEDIVNACKGLKGVAVLDRNISPGAGGIMLPEIRSALYDLKEKSRPIVCGFIDGLGGKDVTLDEFDYMILRTKKAASDGVGVSEIISTKKQDERARMMLSEARGIRKTKEED